MSAADLLGLIVAAALAGYLLYALAAGGAVLAMLQGWIQIIVFAAVLFAVVPLLGGYMARVFTNERVFLTPVVGPLERLVYRVLRVDVERSQGWKSYAGTLLVFSALFWLALYLILRTQTLHPFNPDGFHSRDLGSVVQHRFVVHHEHELAVLRRRDHALVLQPDGRPGGPELRLGRGRHRRRHRADPRASPRAAPARPASATSGRT